MNDILQLQLVFSAIDKVTGPCNKLKSAFEDQRKVVRQLKGELKQLEGQDALANQFKTKSQKVEELSTRLTTLNKDLETLRKRQVETGDTTKRTMQQIIQKTNAIKTMTNRISDQNKTLSEYKQKLGLSTGSLAELNTKQNTLAASIKKSNTALQAQQTLLDKAKTNRNSMNDLRQDYTAKREGINLAQSAGIGMLGTGMAILAPVYKAVDSARELETSFVTMKNTLMDNTGNVPIVEFNGKKVDALNELKKLSIELGNKLPGTTVDIQNMFTALSQQGIKPEQILGGVGKAAAYLGVQLKIPYEEAAKIAAKVKTATNVADKDMMSMMDDLQRISNLGVDQDGLITSFRGLASVIKLTGKEGLEATRILEPLVVTASRMGLNGESGSNAIRKFMDRTLLKDKVADANDTLQGILHKGKKTIKVGPDTGIRLNFLDAKGNYIGIDNAVKQVAQLKGVSDSLKKEVMLQIWGDDAETTSLFQGITQNGIDGYNKIKDDINKQASLQDRVKALLDTYDNKKDGALGTLKNLSAQFGDTLLPILKDVLDKINEMAGALIEWSKAHPETTKAIMKFIAVFGLLITLLGIIALAFAVIFGPTLILRFMFKSLFITAGQGIGIFGNLRKAMGLLSKIDFKGLSKTGFGTIIKLASKLGSVLSFLGRASLGGILKSLKMFGSVFMWVARLAMANPITAVLFGIAALALYIYANWDKFKPYFTKLIDYLTSAWQTFKDWISGIWTGIKDGFSSAWESVKSGFKTALDFMVQIFERSGIGLLFKAGKAAFNFGKDLMAPVATNVQPLPQTNAGASGGFGVLKSSRNTTTHSPVTNYNNFNITNPDPHATSKLVDAKLKEAERKNASRNRSSHKDTD